MTLERLVLGLVDTSAAIGDARLAARARDLTLSWSRFKYDGPVLEAPALDALLEQAAAAGARYLLAQAYGHVLVELWRAGEAPFPDLLHALAGWAPAREFLAAGRLLAGDGGWFGLDPACLLVDLERWTRLGRPASAPPVAGALDLPRARLLGARDAPLAVEPAGGTERASPARPLWGLVRASLDAGLSVPDFGHALRAVMLHLAPETTEGAARLRRSLPHDDGAPREGDADDDSDAARFLAGLRAQAERLRRGVFVWNLEGYDDVRRPAGQRRPLQTLYSVAAGLKPNFMLHTLGADESTRVVYVDYSVPGLEFRRLLREHWDGDDYPAFLRFLFRRLPSSEAAYCLWNDATPETLDWAEVDRRWRDELRAWGGAEALHEHWRLYCRLAHEYVCCDLTRDPSPLWPHLRDEPEAACWWSNAFFSVPGNWTWTADQRERRYRSFIDGLAQRSPRLWLYGASSNNAPVNGLRAADYRHWYTTHAGDALCPGRPPQARGVRF